MGVWNPGPAATAGADTFTGDGTNEVANGLGGNDTLNGNGGADTLEGGAGDDDVFGGAGDDTLVARNSDVLVGEIFDGGGDTDTLLMIGNLFMAARTITSIERLTFSSLLSDYSGFARYDLIISMTQVGAGVSASALITGSPIGDFIEIRALAADDDVDVSGWSFSNWTISFASSVRDFVTINGSTGSNTIVGSSTNDLIAGYEGADILTGGAGADVFYPGSFNPAINDAAADSMAGGLGNDSYYVSASNDTVTENAGEGIDTILSYASYTLPANVEILTLFAGATGVGNAENNTITGNGLDNVLNGLGGIDILNGADGADELSGGTENDTLNGGEGNDILSGGDGIDTLDGGAGDDDMFGGDGDDIYTMDSAADFISENADEGEDWVSSSVTIAALMANVENASLLGAGNINLTGNALNNDLFGNAGANIIDGGAGADTMQGNNGSDTYIVDNSGDVVVELVGEGTDRIHATVSVIASENVERIQLLGTASISATGNALNNVIDGNSGKNVINGMGGADTMRGGGAEDVYHVDNSSDVVVENVGEGTDRIIATVSYSMPGNVERIELTGSADLNITGNGLNNVMDGNAGANRIDGGAGSDTMRGGFGNDTYVVDRSGDTVVEALGAGTDRILASVSVTASDNVEDVALQGSVALDATGNDLANVLDGNVAANTLSGGGGADTLRGYGGIDVLVGGLGNDTLTGGAHADAFVFDTALGAGNVDTITDFSVADDTIRIDNAVFTTVLGGGTLSVGQFRIGSAAADSSDRIIYDPTTGALLYDPDGNGAAAAIQFATLATGLALTNADFFII